MAAKDVRFEAACARIEIAYNQPDMFAPDVPAVKYNHNARELAELVRGK